MNNLGVSKSNGFEILDEPSNFIGVIYDTIRNRI